MSGNIRTIALKLRIVQLTIPTTLTRLDKVLAGATPQLPEGIIIRQVTFLKDATQSFGIYDSVNATQSIPHANGDERSFPIQNADVQLRVKAGTQGTVTAAIWY